MMDARVPIEGIVVAALLRTWNRKGNRVRLQLVQRIWSVHCLFPGLSFVQVSSCNSILRLLPLVSVKTIAGDSTAEELSSSRSSQSASRPSESAGEEMAPTVTYPNPRSFAERLMFVLESRAAPDTIWWEGDGTIVALHIDNIKTGTILRDHFQGIRYKFFIRYFSRW